MTTETQTKPPAQPAKVKFQGLIPVKDITVKEQVRKKFDENAHKELTESIKTKGVISPVTLRARGDGYELVAGERRFRAAKAAGLAEIPAIVRELDDQSAALYQVEENIHRRDLTPIEEARGFKLLTQPVGTSSPKYTVEQLAKLVDKSTGHVYRALALLELPKAAIDAIEDGRFTPAHGHQIMRVPPFEREELANDTLNNGYDGHIATATELRNRIEAHMAVDLAGAPFPKDKQYAGMSPCTTCPSNTGNQGALFDGAEKGQCLNKQCFTTKTKQHKADFLEKTTLAGISLGAMFTEYAKGYVYAGNNRAGGYIVKDRLDPKKAPKGSFGLLINPSNFEIWVAVLDKKVAQAEQAAAAAPAPEDPKVRFIDTAVRSAMYAAGAHAAKKLKMERKDWVDLAKSACDDLPNELWATILGVNPDEGDDGDFEKAPEPSLRAIVLLNRRLPYNPGDADFKKLGVDVAAVKKTAKAQAEAEWAKKNAKHRSVASAGSVVACGLKGGSYAATDPVYTAVPDWDSTTCPACLKKKPKDA